jgi:hypothetical protein
MAAPPSVFDVSGKQIGPGQIRSGAYLANGYVTPKSRGHLLSGQWACHLKVDFTLGEISSGREDP